MFNGFSKQSKISLAVIGFIFLVILIFAAQWALNKNYQSLFIGLEPKDSAIIIQQLDAIGAEYRINSKTGNVEVPSAKLHQIRLQLMSSDIAITGNVGYEIFDNSDFGMTEFAQQINFQRALEGELQRTITSLTQVKQSRVHLVLPERSLFRENKEQPSASVTLVVEKSMPLTATQISGIQRLVSSSVSGLDEHMVMISDQKGVTLNQETPKDGTQAIPWRLKQKQNMENYLVEKVSRVLGYAFNKGEVVVSIDVILDFNQTKKMEEKVIPLEGGKAISKEKELTVGDDKKSKKGGGSSNTTKETEYEVGRSIAETTENPGKIQQISIGVLLTKFLSENDKKQLKQLIKSTVGYNENRGDSIAIYTNLNSRLQNTKPSPVKRIEITEGKIDNFKVIAKDPAKKANAADSIAKTALLKVEQNLGVFLVTFATILMILFLLMAKTLSKKSRASSKRLTHEERDALLIKLQHWLSQEK